MRILITGATGFIGAATTARLLAEGHEVTAVSRRPRPPHGRLLWAEIDLRTAGRADDWLPLLSGVDAVINCAGVLQDSATDSTVAAHVTAPSALFTACEQAGIKRVIQISAIGIDGQTPTAFSRTKKQGDAALMATSLDWVILRPSVVVGRAAYGGSALFRGLAALPVVPRLPDAGRLQIVQLDELVATIVHCLKPDAPSRMELEIAGPERLSFDDTAATYRAWFGWRPARRITVPGWVILAACRIGDVIGWLGWRPPVRTTAQREIARGAVGDPAPWMAATGISPRSLGAALAAEPASVQERWFASLYLLKPLVLGIFSLFWIATAIISLGPGWDIGVGLMHEGGVTGLAAPLTVIAGALADLVIGIGIAVRRTARPALIGALALSLSYVVIGTVLVPRLWIDPIGPMLKIGPILALNLVALAVLEDR